MSAGVTSSQASVSAVSVSESVASSGRLPQTRHHTRTFLFAGGGTGGHLYPGLAIARELTRQSEGRVRSLFICSSRPLDSTILSGENVEFVPLCAQPFSLNPKGFVRFFRAWGAAVRESRLLIRSELERLESPKLSAGANAMAPTIRDQLHVVAMGGFVAAPFVQAARVERVGVTLVNLDAVPGKANRMIARKVRRIFSAAAIAPGALKERDAATWEMVPPIVRPEAIPPANATKADCRSMLGLDPLKPTLLVTGGSQGARSINQLLVALVDGTVSVAGQATTPPGHQLRQGNETWQILHQCGKDDVEVLRLTYRNAGINAVVEPFVRNMGTWWGASDLVIARAGAGNVAEAWANHVPAIFLPYPYHRDLHQKHNARTLVEAGAAVLVNDQIDPTKTLHESGGVLNELLQNASKLRAMEAALSKLGPACGAEIIAAAVLASV